MQQLNENRARPGIGKVLGLAAAALLFAVALLQPDLAKAAHGGGGGGFHGGGGGFHGGGFHGGGFHGGGFGGFHGGGVPGGGFHAGGFHHGFGRFRGGFGGGFGGIYAPYWWDYGYPYSDYGYYPDYGNHYGQPYSKHGQPNAAQTWYYCSNPAGYYPYVTQCNTGWQAVPASWRLESASPPISEAGLCLALEDSHNGVRSAPPSSELSRSRAKAS